MREDVIKAYHEGMLIDDIIRTYCVSRQTVYDWLHQDWRVDRQKASFNKEAIRKAYAEGMPVEELAEKYGVKKGAIYHHIKDMPKHVNADRINETRRQIVELTNQGLGNKEIAEKIGVSRNTVSNYKKELGLSIRYRRST